MTGPLASNRRHNVPLLYKYVTPSTAEAVLTSRALRWSSPKLFNDPFDVRREMELPFTNDELFDAILDRFREYMRGSAVPGNPAVVRLLEGLRVAVHKAPLEEQLIGLRHTLSITVQPMNSARAELKAAWESLLPQMRIVCFSLDPASPPMWAHYASDHTGMVLAFESSDERDSPWLLAEPIVYSEAVPNLPPAVEWAKALMGEQKIDWDSWLREYHFVKSPHWKHEKEYRVHSMRRAGEEGLYSDYTFAPEDLREIIIGSKSSDKTALLAEAAVRFAYPHAAIRRARVNHATHRIEFDEYRRGTT